METLTKSSQIRFQTAMNTFEKNIHHSKNYLNMHMAYIFFNEPFPQFKFAYYWPPIGFLLLVLSRKPKVSGCSLTCLQPQCSIFCFAKLSTDHALSVGMPTFFCGVLTTKWTGFFLLSFCNKTSLNSVLKETDWTVQIKNLRIQQLWISYICSTLT